MIWLSMFNWIRPIIGRSVPNAIVPTIDMVYSEMARIGALDASQKVLRHVLATDDEGNVDDDKVVDHETRQVIGHAADMVVIEAAKGIAHVMRGTNGSLLVCFKGDLRVRRYTCPQLFEHAVLVKLGVNLSALLRNSGV